MRATMHTMRSLLSALAVSSVLLLGLAFLSVGPVAYASDVPGGTLLKSFGGRITAITPCLGVGFVVATILQPPTMKPIQVAALPSPFLYYMMSHPGQFTLGLMGAPVFCLQDWDGDGFESSGSFFYGTSI